jgi:hypothetical protein
LAIASDFRFFRQPPGFESLRDELALKALYFAHEVFMYLFKNP